ncbi:MAG: AGE family epimerase/isomerase [Dysgonamonadaceae bacterium]|jgi:mannobiose 2-epimerase|nr:AGE family epimerase/isomerase [Dysgonamonadaceae bacterium]
MNLKNELTQHILPFWIEKMQDRENGGFYGRIDGCNQLHPQANKGAVLNCRILWTFSAAYRVLKNPEYLQVAQRAYEYIERCFIDREWGGVYWEVDCFGNPVNTKKQSYAQGFALYGFSEFYRATGDMRALERAKEFFRLIENCRDQKLGGYFEAFTRDWQPVDDVRLSDKDENEVKTMNTHLHILEPYTNLLRVWKDESLMTAQRKLIDIFTDKILDKTNFHLKLFFDENWMLKSQGVSYGHDIEASWLLYEAAEVLDDSVLLKKIKTVSLNIADAAAEGLQADGSMIYECRDNMHPLSADFDRHWWVQAETVVGMMYAYRNSGNEIYKLRAQNAWEYIQNNLIDHENGEWHWSRRADGTINRMDDKAGFWKCPYHNGRMCLELEG